VRFILRWFITAIAVAVAAFIVPGIHVNDANGFLIVVLMALVLGLVNAIIRPILAFLSCGCIVATLGLFMIVINAFTFWLAAWFTNLLFPNAFVVDSIWAALFGSIIVSIVSFGLSLLLPDEKAA
jgi:putative membrane protein